MPASFVTPDDSEKNTDNKSRPFVRKNIHDWMRLLTTLHNDPFILYLKQASRNLFWKKTDFYTILLHFQ